MPGPRPPSASSARKALSNPLWAGVASVWTLAILGWVLVAQGIDSGILLTVLGLGAVTLTLLLFTVARRAWARRLDSIAQRTLDLASAVEGKPLAPEPNSDPVETIEAGVGALESRVQERLASLRALTEQLRAMLDVVDEPVVVADASGAVRLVNQAASELVGQPESKLTGRPLETVFTQSDLLELFAAAREGETRRGQVRITRQSVARTYQVSAAPVRAGGQLAGVAITLRDVSELATALARQTDFVANASHELRTPLAAIKGAAETLAEATDDPGMVTRLTRMIATNAQRLEDLAGDLLELNRLDAGLAGASQEIKAVRLRELIDPIVETFGAVAAERQVRIVTEIDAGAEVIRTSPRLLGLVLRNLVDNATKFASPQTDVKVIVQAGEAPAGGLRPCRIRVADRGVGIPLASQPRIFDRFYQVDPSRAGDPARRGSGLGLAIAKHAVLALGGKIGVESVWQVGTTMTVDLPGCLESAISPSSSPGR